MAKNLHISHTIIYLKYVSVQDIHTAVKSKKTPYFEQKQEKIAKYIGKKSHYCYNDFEYHFFIAFL